MFSFLIIEVLLVRMAAAAAAAAAFVMLTKNTRVRSKIGTVFDDDRPGRLKVRTLLLREGVRRQCRRNRSHSRQETTNDVGETGQLEKLVVLQIISVLRMELLIPLSPPTPPQ